MPTFTAEETQPYVDRFLEEIRANGIAIEDVVVKERKFYDPCFQRAMMFTAKGRIFVDPNGYVYSMEEAEYTVLHELGHRAQSVINPRMYSQLKRRFLPRKKSTPICDFLNAFEYAEEFEVLHALREGAADFFALGIFPDFCTISNTCRQFMDAKKMELDGKRTKSAYFYFSRIYSAAGREGIERYIRDVRKYKFPEKGDLADPEDYVKTNFLHTLCA